MKFVKRGIEMDGQEIKIRDKADFYAEEKLPAHVLRIPKGFWNGLFLPNREKKKYYEFIEDRDGVKKKIKLFVSEIYDIVDYKR